MSAAIGFTVPAVQPTSDAGSLSCSYLGGSNTAEINFQTTAAGTTAASLQDQLTSGAASGTTISPVSGYGQAAFSSSETGGFVGLLVWSGSVEFSITGGSSLAGLENVAKKLLAG